jgi:hypothetical protein
MQYWEDKVNDVGGDSTVVMRFMTIEGSVRAVGGSGKKGKGRYSDWNISPFLIRTDIDEKDYLLNSLVIAAACGCA